MASTGRPCGRAPRVLRSAALFSRATSARFAGPVRMPADGEAKRLEGGGANEGVSRPMVKNTRVGAAGGSGKDGASGGEGAGTQGAGTGGSRYDKGSPEATRFNAACVKPFLNTGQRGQAEAFNKGSRRSEGCISPNTAVSSNNKVRRTQDEKGADIVGKSNRRLRRADASGPSSVRRKEGRRTGSGQGLLRVGPSAGLRRVGVKPMAG